MWITIIFLLFYETKRVEFSEFKDIKYILQGHSYFDGI